MIFSRMCATRVIAPQLRTMLYTMLCALCFIAPATNAATPYGGIGANYLRASISDTRFAMASTEARLGVYLLPQIAVELHASTGILDSSEQDAELSLDYSANAYLRLESPERKNMKIYVLLGYGKSSLDLDRSDSGLPGSESFNAASYGLGFEFAVRRQQGLYLNLGWQRHYADGQIELDAAGLSLRMMF